MNSTEYTKIARAADEFGKVVVAMIEIAPGYPISALVVLTNPDHAVPDFRIGEWDGSGIQEWTTIYPSLSLAVEAFPRFAKALDVDGGPFQVFASAF